MKLLSTKYETFSSGTATLFNEMQCIHPFMTSSWFTTLVVMEIKSHIVEQFSDMDAIKLTRNLHWELSTIIFGQTTL